MASICNDERARFGGLSGRGGFVHSLSVFHDADAPPASHETASQQDKLAHMRLRGNDDAI
jgi:hypothetical protein